MGSVRVGNCAQSMPRSHGESRGGSKTGRPLWMGSTQAYGRFRKIIPSINQFTGSLSPSSGNEGYLPWGLQSSPGRVVYPGHSSDQASGKASAPRQYGFRATRDRGRVTLGCGMRIEITVEPPRAAQDRGARSRRCVRAGSSPTRPIPCTRSAAIRSTKRRSTGSTRSSACRRPTPLALVCADLSQVAEYAQLDNAQFRLLRRVLPGPYTFILEATRETPRALHLKDRTVGVRVPKSEVALALVRELGHPIISTTAARTTATSRRSTRRTSPRAFHGWSSCSMRDRSAAQCRRRSWIYRTG